MHATLAAVSGTDLVFFSASLDGASVPLEDFGAWEQVIGTSVKECANPRSIILPCCKGTSVWMGRKTRVGSLVLRIRSFGREAKQDSD
jgi:hypothetical protein